jgi:hypothetical protein
VNCLFPEHNIGSSFSSQLRIFSFKPQYHQKKKERIFSAGGQWFMPVILATWKVEIGRSVF